MHAPLPIGLLVLFLSTSLASTPNDLRPRGIFIPKIPKPEIPVPPIKPKAPSIGSSNPGEEFGDTNPSPVKESPGEEFGDTNPSPADDSPTAPIYDSTPNEAPEPAKPDEDSDETGSEIASAFKDILDELTNLISTQDSTTVTATAALPTAAYPCASANNIYAYCASASSNFSSALATQQASCLCYEQASSGEEITYAPRVFDDYIGSCNTYLMAQTASWSLSAQATGLAAVVELCGSVGDVRASASISATAGASATGGLSASASASAAATTTPAAMATSGSRGRGGILNQALIGAGAVLGAGFL
ncbi:hypothetical protein MMC21_001305 [Puttea exsequens]|nr:hypothetical protein [Puttea exsequens]